MFRCLLPIPVFLFSTSWVAASESPLICFGVEPSWSVHLTTPGTASFATPEDEPVIFDGATTRNEVLRESVWRGSPAAGRDLVVFLREAACSDTMSDTEHPVVARVSSPDGRFLTGCCRVPAPAGVEVTLQPLDGVSWRLTGMPGMDKNELAALERKVVVRFEAGRLSGFSGCNSFVGAYSMRADSVDLDQLAGTLMACPDPAQTIESRFRAAFAGTLRYELTDSGLRLTAASGEVLTFEPEPEPKLAGSSWEVTGFNNNRQAVVSPDSGSRISLTFDESMVSGNAGCNTYSASYLAQGNSIEFGPAATTRRACAEELMAQEQTFLAALESAVKWRIEGNTLDMHRADEERAIHANRTR